MNKQLNSAHAAIRFWSMTLAAGLVLVAPKAARADVQGPSVGQSSWTVTGTINEGSSTAVGLTLSINGETNASGTLGTTTHRFNANTLTLTAPGNNGGSTTPAGGAGGTTQSFGTNLTYNQNGVYNISFGQNFSVNTRENPGPASGSNNINWNSFQANNANVTVLNVAPTITTANQNGTNGTVTVNEGNAVSLNMQATDPGADSQVFTINGVSQPSGVGGNVAGSTRTSNTVSSPTYVQQGAYFNTFQVTDQDGASASNGTIIRQVNVDNVLPQSLLLTLSSSTINEGDSITATLSATDPGADFLTFDVNGNNIGTGSGGNTPGSTRSATSGSLGPYYQSGPTPSTYNFFGDVTDDTGTSSVGPTILTVLNLAPTVISIQADLDVYILNPIPFSAFATDPGIFDNLTYEWDWDNDGFYDDFVGASGNIPYSSYSGWITPPPFPPYYIYPIKVRVTDGEGGFDFEQFNVRIVPEPGSIVAWSLLGAIGLGVSWWKKRRTA